MSPPGRPNRDARRREQFARAVVGVLAQARRDAGLTRQGLANASGVSINTIAKIEQAAVTDPGFAVVVTLAHSLGLPLDALASRAKQRLPDNHGVVGPDLTLEPPESPT